MSNRTLPKDWIVLNHTRHQPLYTYKIEIQLPEAFKAQIAEQVKIALDKEEVVPGKDYILKGASLTLFAEPISAPITF